MSKDDNPQVKPPLRMSFSSDLQCALEQLGQFVEEAGHKYCLSIRDTFQWRMILEELITNTINYGFSGGTGDKIEVELLAIDDDVCRIRYIDDAPPFDSSAEHVPEELAKTEAMGFGGMGLDFVRQMADSFEYQHENGLNCITIIKRRNN